MYIARVLDLKVDGVATYTYIHIQRICIYATRLVDEPRLPPAKVQPRVA